MGSAEEAAAGEVTGQDGPHNSRPSPPARGGVPDCPPALLQDASWFAATERDDFHLVRKKLPTDIAFIFKRRRNGRTTPPHYCAPQPPHRFHTYPHTPTQTTECFQMFVERAWACAGGATGVDER